MGNQADENGYEEKQITVDQLFSKYGTSEKGLTEYEVKERFAKYGPNEIIETKKKSAIMLLLSQFGNTIQLILLIAAIISWFLGNIKDAIAIVFAILLSGFIGFFQEYRAEKAIEYLKKLAVQNVRIRRDGSELIVHSNELVPGDLVIIEEGMRVPADIRVIKSLNLACNESTLTGESLAVEKYNEPKKDNILYSGTIVSSGKGEGVVIRTGMESELGKIAKLVSETDGGQTPLQKNLNELGKKIGYMVIAMSLAFFVIGYFVLGKELGYMLTTAVILVVAGVSEGLPTVIAITLALGMQRMAKKNSIVKKMSAIEDLGLITVICTDKTGTLTENSMKPKHVYVYDDLSSSGEKLAKNKQTQLLFAAAVIANNASIDRNGNLVGDPTETGLLDCAKQSGFDPFEMKSAYGIIHENPFDSSRKMMSVVSDYPDSQKGKQLFVKGAIESIIANSDKLLTKNGIIKFDKTKKSEVLARANEVASKGMRVLAMAHKEHKEKVKNPDKSDYSDESGLIFIGFISLYDPPRPEAKAALVECVRAGISVFMVTGDSKETALNIANEVSFPSKNAMSGSEFESLSNEKQSQEKQKVSLKDVRIFYRVSPAQKHMIVSRLKEMGEIVAVTGDGVNDAPALKKADIGISMGDIGSDVAKEASSMILLDDNFATIVKAIEYGRKVYENILNFVRFQITTTIALLSTVFFATVLGFMAPINAIQMLFLNIIMDGPPALALGLEPETKRIMEKPPRDPKAPYISKQFISLILFDGLFITLAMLVMLQVMNMMNIGPEKYLTISFFTLVSFQLFNALNCRSRDRGFYENLFGNKILLLSIGGSFAILLLFIFVPALEEFMHTVPLTAYEITVSLVYAASILVVEEIRKKLKLFLL
ncbi:calcium-translocating P-type ATPase, PMCA-type [Candidatus Micrarchaeota archaeon]|nr:calcium-translocating P-type ATPase, PMCA-type [Candidatus Micrarchaeota archaeon]